MCLGTFDFGSTGFTFGFGNYMKFYVGMVPS